MGFFALLRDKTPSDYVVRACHICYWVLPNRLLRFPRLKHYFDVGVRLCPAQDLSRIRIALPFDAQKPDLSDLSSVVLSREHAPLIFGGPVDINGTEISYDGSSVGSARITENVFAIDEEKSKPDSTRKKGKGFSTWEIVLRDTAKAGKPIYIRFRFRVWNPKRIWASKGWGYAKNGVLVDLRIADVRESVLVGDARPQPEDVVNIESLFVFVVASAHFVPQRSSPELHYSRLLEPKAWEMYLRTCESYRKREKFSIHQWRGLQRKDSSGNPVPVPVSMTNPFRAYMDLKKEFGADIWLYFLIGTLGIGIFSHLTSLVVPWLIGKLGCVYNILVAWLKL